MQRFALPIVSIFVISACTPIISPTEFPDVDKQSLEAEIRTVVESFGARLQMVSLLAPDAASQIEQDYSEFVAPELLQGWIADPASAPGRLTSSPWPDHIEINEVQLQGPDQYLVAGVVIEVTSTEQMSGGVAALYPVQITLSNVGGNWLITTWQPGEYQ